MRMLIGIFAEEVWLHFATAWLRKRWPQKSHA